MGTDSKEEEDASADESPPAGVTRNELLLLVGLLHAPPTFRELLVSEEDRRNCS